MYSNATFLELGEKPVGQLLLKYATPAVIAMTASSLYNIIDAISVLLLFLRQKYHSSYSTATQRGIVDIERPQTSIIYGIRKTFIPSAECNYDG